MSNSAHSYKKFTVLVGVLVVAGIAAMWVLKNAQESTPENGNGGTSEVTNDKNDTDKNKITKGEEKKISVADPPEKTGQPERIRQTYEEGKTYRRTVDYQVEAEGRHKEWGLGVDFNVLYAGRVIVDHTILTNDGYNLEYRMKVSDAKTITAREEVEAGTLKLGERVHFILEQLGKHTPIPSDISRLLEEELNKYLHSDLGEELMELIPIKAVEIEDIEGFEFKVNYKDGKGVTSMKLTDVPDHRDFGDSVAGLHPEELEKWAKKSIIVPNIDVYLFPDEEVDVGEEWQVRGRDFPEALPADLNGRLDGQITMKREKDKNDLVKLRSTGGDSLLLIASPKGQVIRGKFSLEGSMTYDPEKRLVTHGKFTGKAPIRKRSTDHWFFEMRHNIDPEIKVEYNCEIVED